MINPFKDAFSRESIKFYWVSFILRMTLVSSLFVASSLLHLPTNGGPAAANTILFMGVLALACFGVLLVAAGRERNERAQFFERFNFWKFVGVILAFMGIVNISLSLVGLVGLSDLPALTGRYMVISDMDVISDESIDNESEKYPDEIIGNFSYVVKIDIDDRGIGVINNHLRNSGAHTSIRRSTSGFSASLGRNHDGGEFWTRRYLFWQTAACYGSEPMPPSDFPGNYNAQPLFQLCPYYVLEFVIGQTLCCILASFVAWVFRAYISPSVFNKKREPEQLVD